MKIRARIACATLLFAACADPEMRPPPAPRDLSIPDAPVDAGPCGPCPKEASKCDPKSKMCVACLVDPDCGAGAVCRMGACMPGCSRTNAACGADAGSCDVDMGICRGCLSDKECTEPGMKSCDARTGLCGGCTPQNDKCPAGEFCDGSAGAPACRPGCKLDIECQTIDGGSASYACCDHRCVDTASALAHCGACGKTCDKSDCCGGACIDVGTDIAHCGGCGVRCPSRNNMPLCQVGKCGTGGCLPGFGDCDNNAMNGCEISTATDRNNCGACGMVCALPNALNACIDGKCEISACLQGFRNCNANQNDGCEANLQMDAANCGACGQNCAALPNAMAGCAAGKCAIGSCKTGFANCNMDDLDGCEVETATDGKNCGGCGMACPTPPGVTPICKNGVCGVGPCLPGFTDCDMNPQTGCEVQTGTDPKNCGACGKMCPAYANSTASCTNGMCMLACNAGWGDCDGNVQNGCELDVRADANNCGACGKACMAPAMCVQGACVLGPACSNGSFLDCNPQGTTLVPASAFVDRAPPQGWTQCFGMQNTVADDVTNQALDNCLNTTRLRLRVWDANNQLVVDVFHTNLISYGNWPGSPAYLDGCNCRGALQLAVCTPMYWPCNNNSTFYTSTSGSGGGGCGGFRAGAPTLSNGNATPMTLAIGELDAREIWAGPCYGNTPWQNFKAAVYK